MRNILKYLSSVCFLSQLTFTPRSAKDSLFISSVLSSGEWFRIAVTADGIYRIDYSKLKQLGLADPSNPRIFCNNSGQLIIL